MPNNDKHVTWGGRFSAQPDALMQVFGESVSFDKRLASYDLQGSLGHAAMLSHVGLLSEDEFRDIKVGIEQLQQEVGRFSMETGIGRCSYESRRP